MNKKLSMFLATAVAAVSVLGGTAACKKDSGYDLVYANWNLGTVAGNNIERQMIAEFEKRNNVKIKIEESISVAAYEDSIRYLAVRNKLPDVFMLTNINFGLYERYVADLSDLIENDEDWDKIPKPIEEAVHFKSGVYAVPFAMNIMGYFVNEDLLNKYNVREFDGEITMDNFIKVVSDMAAKKTNGELGLNDEASIIEWYPSSVNDNYGWFTWDGAEYHLDSDNFRRGIEIAQDMYNNHYTYTSLTDEERNKAFSDVNSAVELWDHGRLAIRWGSTYELPDMMDKSGFNKRFIGVPGGRTPIVGDYLALSPTCKNTDLAYKFAKWMSFDPAGIRERIKRNSEVSNTLPLTTDTEIVEEYFDKFGAVDGILQAFETLDNGIVECVKVVPGYNRSRWTALTGVKLTSEQETIENANIGQLLDWCRTGRESYADYALNVNKLANQWYSGTIEEYEGYYD